jgi:hypothetical protein
VRKGLFPLPISKTLFLGPVSGLRGKQCRWQRRLLTSWQLEQEGTEHSRKHAPSDPMLLKACHLSPSADGTLTVSFLSLAHCLATNISTSVFWEHVIGKSQWNLILLSAVCQWGSYCPQCASEDPTVHSVPVRILLSSVCQWGSTVHSVPVRILLSTGWKWGSAVHRVPVRILLSTEYQWGSYCPQCASEDLLSSVCQWGSYCQQCASEDPTVHSVPVRILLSTGCQWGSFCPQSTSEDCWSLVT